MHSICWKLPVLLFSAFALITCGGGGGGGTAGQPKLGVTLMLAPSPTVSLTCDDSLTFVANVQVDTLGMNLYSDSHFGIQWSTTGGILAPIVGQNIAWRSWTAPGSPGNHSVTLTSTYDPSKSLTTAITVVAKPAITAFTAGTLNLNFGDSTTLTPTFLAGTGNLTPGIGTVSSGVPVTVSPGQDTTYLLTVTNALGKTATRSLTIHVIGGGDPSIAGFTATPSQVKSGQSATLHAVYGSNGIASIAPTLGAIGSSGDVTIGSGPLTSNTTFTLSVTTHTGTVTAQAAVDVVPGLFTLTGAMAQDREYFNPVLLMDGRVLAAGGQGNNPPGPQGNPAVDTAEIYSPETGAFSPTGHLVVARYGATVTRLQNGKVLFLGGFNFLPPGTSGQALDSAEIYDPSTGQFTLLGQHMARPRGMADAVLLADGRVLIIGGSTQGLGTGAPMAEVFDPATNTFQATANDPQGDSTCIFQQLVRLSDSKVLVFGRNAGADLFDPATLTFTATGSPVNSRNAATSRLLQDGRVLTLGGGVMESYQSAELYDPGTGTFTVLGATLSQSHYRSGAAFLPSGRLLVLGGQPGIVSSEEFDPATLTFTVSGRPHFTRWSADLVALPSGKILAFSGAKEAELYE